MLVVMASRTTDGGVDKATAPPLPEPQANATPKPYIDHFKVRVRVLWVLWMGLHASSALKMPLIE